MIGLLDAINNMDSVKWCGTYVVDTLYFDEKGMGWKKYIMNIIQKGICIEVLCIWRIM